MERPGTDVPQFHHPATRPLSDAEETIAVFLTSFPYRAASVRKQAAAVQLPYGFTDAVASTILFSNMKKNGKPVARRHVLGAS